MSTRYRVSKKVMAIILIMMMVIGSIPGLFTAGEGKVFAAGFRYGDGSAVNPYLISSPGELDYIRDYPGMNFKLVNDIDLTEYLSETGAGYNNGAFWAPIYNLSGTFDGDGYVIKGLKINRYMNNVGLFGYTEQGAFITSIGLEDVEITGGNTFVGALVGNMGSGSLSNSYATGNVSGTYYVGGLVGYQGSGSILNSYSSVNVSGAYIGGLLGLQNAGSLSNGYAAGLLTPFGGWFGGLVGMGSDFKGRYDWEVSGNDAQGDPGAKTTLEMQQQSTFEGWDFDDVWVMLPNQYPQLRVFVAAKPPVSYPDPTAGSVAIGSKVTLTSGTAGASIYYTTNGDDPTTASDLYDSSTPIEVNDDVTIKAIAGYPGKLESPIMSKSYKIIRSNAPSTGTLEKGTSLGTTKLSHVTALMEYKVNDRGYQRINGTFVDDIIVSEGDKINVRFFADSPNVASYSQELIVVKADIRPKTDATLTSTIGTVSKNGTKNETVTAIPYGTTLAALKAAITPAADATFNVYLADGITEATTLATGNKIIVTAEDGVTQVTYTVTIVLNGNARLTSGIGTVSTNGTGNETLKAIPYGTTLATLKAYIKPAAGATFNVYLADGITEATTLATGNKIIVTAEDGVTQVTYTVTIVLNGDARLTSTIGTVSTNGTDNRTLTAIPYGTTLAALKAAITPAEGATFNVYHADGITEATALATGNKIIVIAENGISSITYTVTISKNADATLTSTIGTVSKNGTGNETLTAIPYGTTLAALKAAITSVGDTTYGIYNADGITEATTLVTGNKIIVTAEDGVTKVTYTVTVLKKTDATLTATIGTVSKNGTGNETITAILYGTTLAELKAAITPAADATYEVYRADGITEATALATGNKIIVTAEDGVTKVTYTVTVLKNTEATLTSTIGTVSTNGTGNETITAIPYGTTLAELKAAITPAADATYEVYHADGITEATALATGNKIIVTAEDGVTKVTYTVTVNVNEAALPVDGGNNGSIPAPPIGGSNGGNVPTPGKVTSTDGRLTIPTGTIGEVSLEDGITITVPTGAADQELKITITRVLDTRNVLINKEILASQVYEVLKSLPSNFMKPVTLTFAFDSKKVKSGQGVAVFYFDEVKKIWVEVKGAKISGNHITVEVNHFTKFAVLVVDQTTDLPVSEVITPAEPEISFSDIAAHWAEASIKQAVKGGIVNGYVDGTFKPGNTITRAEFSVMLMKAIKRQEAGTELTFTDKADIGTWAQAAVAQAVQAGIIYGYEDGTFRPNANMTRAEMATMIAKALQLSLDETAVTSFADDQAIPVWAKGAVASLKERGIVNGKGANTFNPRAQTTRAEAVVMLLNMLNLTK
jgi:hypothetical protein